ncbi:MAG: DNA polymerase IV, partial [Litorilinea sp.]
DHARYREMSRAVMARVQALTLLVEQISIDEAFLDVSDRVESGEVIARALQVQIREELGLPCSLGIATNKLVAKIANNVGKAATPKDGPPNALTVVPPGTEAAFLAPLACDELWGVGPKTAARLQALGIHSIGDLAQRTPGELGARFGEIGRQLALRARGIDERAVETEHETKSVSQETTFVRDIADRAQLLETLRQLAEGVARDLRRKQLVGSTVKLKLRWTDFNTPTRQTTLAQPTDDGARIYDTAVQLFDRLWQPPAPIRLLGVGVSGLSEPVGQLGLWDVPDLRTERISGALARLREKYGEEVVVRGSDMTDDPGAERRLINGPNPGDSNTHNNTKTHATQAGGIYRRRKP